jgi:hypothetical protein
LNFSGQLLELHAKISSDFRWVKETKYFLNKIKKCSIQMLCVKRNSFPRHETKVSKALLRIIQIATFREPSKSTDNSK